MDYVFAGGNAIVANAPYLVGFVLPPLIEVLNRDIKKENERFIVAVIICLLAASLIHWKEIADGSPEKVALLAGVIFWESQSVFKLYFAKSWMRGYIQAKVGTNEQRESINPEAEEALTPTIEQVKQ